EIDYDFVLGESLLRFIKTVIKNKNFKLRSSIPTYLAGIAKYVCLETQRKEKKHKNADFKYNQQVELSPSPEEIIIDFEKKILIRSLLPKLGKNCKEVLMYWANGYKMKEIAEMMDYKSEGMAKKKKHICFKALLEYVVENPEVKNLLK
ncbi:MAG: sigma-70 family RNA polymerase sigma factor, partial [Saprospiraceae bacterium]